jgi:hypothetical protein
MGLYSIPPSVEVETATVPEIPDNELLRLYTTKRKFKINK